MGYTPTVPPANRPYDLYKNQFASVGGSVVTQKVVATFDMFPPVERYINYRHKGYAPFIMLFKALGYSKGSATPTLGHFERLWDENTIKVGAKSGGATAGAAAVITLDAINMVNVGASINGTALQGSVVRLNDRLKLKTGQTVQVTAINRTVTPHTVTVLPVDGTVTLTSLITVGDIIIITDNAYSEGSGLGEGMTPQYIKYGNTFQIIKERASSTGSNMTNVLRVSDPNVGSGQQSYFDIVDFDMEKRFEMKRSMALLAGEQNSNALLYDYNTERGIDAPMSGTEGFLKFAELNGYTNTYTVGTTSITSFDALNRIYMNERIGTRELMTLDGYAILQETENALLNYFNTEQDMYLNNTIANANASWGDQPYTESDLSVAIGFKAIRKGGFTYRFSVCHEFNDIQSFGATGYNYQNWRLVLPMGAKLNVTTNQQTSMFGYEYKELNGYSRESVVGQLSGAGIVTPVVTNQYDIKSVFMLSEFAAHMACANAIVRQIPV